jgi:hypothetical protein
MRAWRWWVAQCTQPFDTRAYALARIGLALCILADLTHIGAVGVADELFHTFEHGGLSAFAGVDYRLDSWLGPEGGMIAFGVTIASMLCVLFGVGTRPAMLIGVLAYSQLGALYPPGDRAVDRIMRTALLVLLFSGAHTRLSLGRRLRKVAAALTAPAWPAIVIRVFLAIIYISAGLGKLGSPLMGRDPTLYRILTDPTAGRLDHIAWADTDLLFHLGWWGTLVLELTSPLLLTPLAPWWAIFGAGMHLGIAATMRLGVFSWGMLALYPILFEPWLRRKPTQ